MMMSLFPNLKSAWGSNRRTFVSKMNALRIAYQRSLLKRFNSWQYQQLQTEIGILCLPCLDCRTVRIKSARKSEPHRDLNEIAALAIDARHGAEFFSISERVNRNQTEIYAKTK